MNKKSKKYFEFLINEYKEGRAKIRGQHPPEVKEAIDTFFKACQMLSEVKEIETIPTEYVEKLIASFAQHPQYHQLALDILGILSLDLDNLNEE